MATIPDIAESAWIAHQWQMTAPTEELEMLHFHHFNACMYRLRNEGVEEVLITETVLKYSEQTEYPKYRRVNAGTGRKN